jgi:hypothetical protein
MGTSVALGVAAGKLFAGVAVTAEAEAAIGPLAVDRAAAGALDTAPAAAAEDAPGLQAGSASPTPTPSTEMPTTLVMRVKRCGFIVASLLV